MVLSCALLAASPLRACDALEALVRGVDGGDLSQSALSEPEQCGLAQTVEGGLERHCTWAFGFRADEGERLFRSLLGDLQTCGKAVAAVEAQVNHPDSYDQQRFVLGDHRVSLALKDKGALQATYLFLRVARMR